MMNMICMMMSVQMRFSFATISSGSLKECSIFFFNNWQMQYETKTKKRTNILCKISTIYAHHIKL